MSYSIDPVRGPTKAAALAALAVEFDTKVLPVQPDHAHDRDAHLANMERELALLPEASAEQEFAVGMSGWLSWRNAPDGSKQFVGGGFSGNASLVPRPATIATQPAVDAKPVADQAIGMSTITPAS